jgi:comEA protein
MRKEIGYALIILGFFGFIYFNNTNPKEDTVEYQPYNFQTQDTKSYDLQYVEIRGEVRFPGVYELNGQEIIKNIIDKAGGLTEKADISSINQADLVESNMLIIIPRLEETEFYEEENNKSVYVDIKGEVKKPGVYQVTRNTRIFDLIAIAGGLTDKADISRINLSELIDDGYLLIIPAKIQEESFLVYIEGAIKKSGYYEVKNGTTVLDLVKTAGGLLESADKSKIDFTETLKPGQLVNVPYITEKEKIYVAIRGEVVKPDIYYVYEDITVVELINLAGGLTVNANFYLIDYEQKLLSGSVVLIPSLNKEEEAKSDLININTADIETLITLTGIGNILAERIIEYRNEHGGFDSIEEIQLVSGIKSSVYEKIKDKITV